MSGLGLLLLTAAQPKALTWHHTGHGESSAAAGTQTDGGDESPAAPAPQTPDGRKKREPLTLAATLPQTMSPRSPVGSVSEAERQAGDGKPRNTLGDCPDRDPIASAIAGAMQANPADAFVEITADGWATPPPTTRRLLCVISPAGPPVA